MIVASFTDNPTSVSLVVRKANPVQTSALIGRVSMRCLLERGGIRESCR